MRRFLIATSLALLLGSGLLFVVLSFPSAGNNPILRRVEEELQQYHLGLLSPVAQWKALLGDPQVLRTEKGIPVYYYWSSRGFGVFVNPSYRGQRYLKEEDRQVTCIILACREEIEARPRALKETLRFKTVTNLGIGGKPLCELREEDIRKWYWFRLDGEGEVVIYFNFPYRIVDMVGTAIRWRDGKPEQISLNYISFLGNYD